MTAYYNELDPYAAQWLRNLVGAGHIAHGFIDHDDINNLEVTDIIGYDQYHFFAGIGVWSYALKQAGWPDHVPVWTGSCPCQPFSTAGRRKGFDDTRHLWPKWFEFIDAHEPPVIFGEQVASPDGLAWFDTVCADLEGAGYSVGAADLCAAGIGAPHIRQRLYFVAIANDERRKGIRLQLRKRRPLQSVLEARRSSTPLGPGNARSEGGGRHGRSVLGSQGESTREGIATGHQSHKLESTNATRGFWKDVEWLPCADGKARPTQPGLFPLAHGATARVGRLRAYGNAIVPQVAATFIRAVMDVV